MLNVYFSNIIRDKFSRVTRTKDNLHEYQHTAEKFLIANPFSALFIDCGLGKTAISLTALIKLITSFQTNTALIIAPIRVANETWPTEIGEWEHTAPLSYYHIRNPKLVDDINTAGEAARKLILDQAYIDSELMLKDERALFIKDVRGSLTTKLTVELSRLEASKIAVRKYFKTSCASVHIINREQVEFLVDAWGRDWPYDTVIIDESSAFKDHTTNRFKALKRVRKLIKRMHQLTATPVAESYLHLFAQIYLLDMGERLGKSITQYQSKYFDFNRWSMKYTLKDGAEAEIITKISDICLVMKAEDYLDMEYPTFLMDQIILNPDEKQIYMSMQDTFVTTLLDGTVIEAETAAARSQKLQQIASGVVYQTVQSLDEYGEITDSRIVHNVHSHKIDKLRQIIEEANGESILVAYILKSSLARLKVEFPAAVVMDKQGKCIPDWNKGKIKLLLFSPMSSAHGLNLQHGGRTLIFFDIPWSFELYYQAWKRLARQGQKLAVFVRHIVAQDSIDYAIAQCLSDKDATQDKFFKLLKLIRNKLISA